MVSHPEHDRDTMEVLVIVAMPSVQTCVSEKAWEQDILNAVSTAVSADKTLNTLAVRPLEYEDCQWIFEGGMPIPKYDVTVFQDGSWHSGTVLYPTNPETSGQDMRSLYDYLSAKGFMAE